jgi:predicted aconitase with swiveling domain
MLGITPEARSLEEALGGQAPEARIRVDRAEIARVMEQMGAVREGPVDVVGIGCPHASIDQFRRYAELLEGKRVHPDVQLWVCANTVVEAGDGATLGLCGHHRAGGGQAARGHVPQRLSPRRLGLPPTGDGLGQVRLLYAHDGGHRVRVHEHRGMHPGRRQRAGGGRMSQAKVLRGRGCATGEFEGEIVVSAQPFGFWQGLDPQTGVVIDKRHDCCGTSIKGKAFAFPSGRGSTGTPGIFLEAVRNGCAPAAIVNGASEPMIIMCALLAEAFFHVAIPVVEVPGALPHEVLRTGDRVRVNGSNGTVEVLETGG